MSLVTMGIPCATFCIAQKLEVIASMRRTNKAPRAQLIYEICLCLVLPIVYALLTLLSQGHRFNIIEGQGCSPAIFLSPVSIVIDYGMPLSLSVLSIIYSRMYLMETPLLTGSDRFKAFFGTQARFWVSLGKKRKYSEHKEISSHDFLYTDWPTDQFPCLTRRIYIGALVQESRIIHIMGPGSSSIFTSCWVPRICVG